MTSAESSALEVNEVSGRLGKGGMALVIIGVVLVFDLLTKAWIVDNFNLYQSTPILGDFFRLTYTHNRGAAFGIHVGDHSRLFFLVLSLVALGVLALIYRATPVTDRIRIAALSLVAGGAIGNIIDRIRYERGVVDFLDVGIGPHRWPVFNVADMAVSSGAILLLISFYFEEHREREREEGEGNGKSARAERTRNADSPERVGRTRGAGRSTPEGVERVGPAPE